MVCAKRNVHRTSNLGMWSQNSVYLYIYIYKNWKAQCIVLFSLFVYKTEKKNKIEQCMDQWFTPHVTDTMQLIITTVCERAGLTVASLYGNIIYEIYQYINMSTNVSLHLEIHLLIYCITTLYVCIHVSLYVSA